MCANQVRLAGETRSGEWGEKNSIEKLFLWPINKNYHAKNSKHNSAREKCYAIETNKTATK